MNFLTFPTATLVGVIASCGIILFVPNLLPKKMELLKAQEEYGQLLGMTLLFAAIVVLFRITNCYLL